MRKKVRLVSLLGWLLSLVVFVVLLIWMNKVSDQMVLYQTLAGIWGWDILFGVTAFFVLIASFARKGKKVSQEQKAITGKVSFLHKQRSPWFLVSAFLLLLLYAFQVARTGSLVLGIKIGLTKDCYINGVNMHATSEKCNEMLDYIKTITPIISPTPPVLIDCVINGVTEQMVQEACDYLKNNPPPLKTYVAQPAVGKIIDCVGPDGKHMQITYQECVNFNNAWNGIKTDVLVDPNAWGVANQTGEHSWTMNIGSDPKMTTPQELYEALNNYRRVQGRSTLGWNDNLAKFAQSRAEEQAKAGKSDVHAGFNSYVSNPDNLRNLGFWAVGENSSYGFVLSGVHFIEWTYAGDKPHNDNQLDPSWTNVGVGVSGVVTDIIFGHN